MGTPVFGEGSIGRTKSVADNGISVAWRSSKTEPVRGDEGQAPELISLNNINKKLAFCQLLDCGIFGYPYSYFSFKSRV